MTKINFYLLSEQETAARYLFFCKLTHKMLRLGHKVYIHCDDETQAQEIDDLLWSFKKHSFVPHKQRQQEGADCSVEIGFQSQLMDHHGDILLNVSNHQPAFFAQFSHLSEVVIQKPCCLAASRKNYAFYKKRNYPICHHQL